MTFDEWVDAEFAIDDDPDSFEHRLAKRAWDAAVKSEREACLAGVRGVMVTDNSMSTRIGENDEITT